MDDSLKQDRNDLYAALMLSTLLDSEHNNVSEQQQQLKQTEVITETDVIWVPADKHPEIAPTEFANFIKTHGTTSNNNNSLHRKKSILSQSLSVQSTRRRSRVQNEHDDDDDDDDDEDRDLNRTLSEKKRNFLKKVMSDSEKLKVLDTHVFDRNSTSFDDSIIIAPRKTDKSLLRRSAFSARGKSRKSVSMDRQQQRQEQQQKVVLDQDGGDEKVTHWDKSEGVSLYDQPVNMSEWIDLGSASLESGDSQRGILSRVHDAESQFLLSQIEVEEETETEEETEVEEGELEGKVEIEAGVEENLQQPQPQPQPQPQTQQLQTQQPQPLQQLKPLQRLPTITTTKQEKPSNIMIKQVPKRPSMIRLATTPTAATTTTTTKRTSWLGGLFQQDKKNGKNNKKPTSSSTTLSGLATLFTRSLSMKSINTITNNTTTNTTTTNTTTTTTTTTITMPNTSTNDKKKRSSRLEIPPPSERTFFNSNRLPLHVERAIYRLSHMKLADPKRPLRQQVFISNLMFWYLSIQQNDFQKQQQDMALTSSITSITTPKKSTSNKMTRLIHSAKKRKSEVTHHIKKSNNNVQFSLPSIPSHHREQEQEEEEEDDVPLSHFRQ